MKRTLAAAAAVAAIASLFAVTRGSAASLEVSADRLTVIGPPESITLTAVADVHYTNATTRVDSTTTLEVNPHLSGGSPSVNNRQTFVLFDLSGIPEGATIESATLLMTRHVIPSNRTYAAQPAASVWSESSGDRPAVDGPLASAQPGSSTSVSWDVTDAVEEFLGGTRSNYGWRIQDTASTGNIPSQFRPHEWTTASERPTLVITYA